MFKTRSRFRPAPAISRSAAVDTGVLLVGHGSPRWPGPARTLAGHAQSLAGLGVYGAVRYATLAGGPDPARELAALASAAHVVVLPMFMSDGYLARQVLPERLGAGAKDPRVRIAPPLGLMPGLAHLIADVAEETRRAQGWRRGDWELILAAHGSSSDPASREAAQALSRRLAGLPTAARIHTAFLEEPPFLDGIFAQLTRSAVVVGLFVADGGHATKDVPAALESACQPVAYAGAIGCDPRIVGLIQEALTDRQPTALATV
jgi:sirohydrochlorin ferrochelatase